MWAWWALTAAASMSLTGSHRCGHDVVVCRLWGALSCMSALPGMMETHALPGTQDGFVVESTSGARFEEVDISEREWMDYDEKLGEPVGIYDLEWKLQAVKL